MPAMGKSHGEMIPSMGSGIVAGCKRSQSLAKAYTNDSVDGLRKNFTVHLPDIVFRGTARCKAMARIKHLRVGGIRVYQHVDDLTQVMWARSDEDLASAAYESAREWVQQVHLGLSMECITKHVILPPGIPARVAQRALLEFGLEVTIAAHGVDVGVDITGGHGRKG